MKLVSAGGKLIALLLSGGHPECVCLVLLRDTQHLKE